MKGKHLTLVSSTWLVIDSVLFATRHLWWSELFYDQTKFMVVAFGHIISELMSAMGVAFVVLAVGIALWISQKEAE